MTTAFLRPVESAASLDGGAGSSVARQISLGHEDAAPAVPSPAAEVAAGSAEDETTAAPGPKAMLGAYELSTVVMWVCLAAFSAVYLLLGLPLVALIGAVYFVKLDRAPAWFEQILQQYLPAVFPPPKK